MGDKLSLEENIIKYKDITLSIIEIVKSEKYEKLNENFNQRQLILKDMNKSNYTKKELNTYYLRYEIEKLNKILSSEMRVKRLSLLKKIKSNRNKQVGMAGYNNISATAVFLSKKI